MPRSPDSYRHKLEDIGPPPGGPESGVPSKPDTRPLAERGEELYALWAEYRRRKFEIFTELRARRKDSFPSQQRGSERGSAGSKPDTAATALAADPDLQRFGTAIAARWRDPVLQGAFTAVRRLRRTAMRSLSLNRSNVALACAR